MEQNLPIMTKKVWSIIRAIFFTLKRGISKSKFFADLDMMMKRGKIKGKALNNLLFHHHHNWAANIFHQRRSNSHHLPFPSPPSTEHEFSCTTTPQYPLSLFSTHKKHHTPQHVEGIDEMVLDPEVIKALEMLTSVTSSPLLPGFGKSPMVRQLRITDSPFPLSNGGQEDGKVDEDAEKFIVRFYNGLRRQN